MNDPAIEMTRRRLYDEVWSISVAGISRKYDIPYSLLLTQVKDAGIPIPSGGYWTKLKLGMPVETIPFEGISDEIVRLYREKTGRASARISKPSQEKSITNDIIPECTPQEIPLKPEEVSRQKEDASDSGIEEIQAGTFENDIFDRNTLYDEVWKKTLPDIAQEYHVSESSLKKICSALSIPTPSASFLHRMQTGKAVPEKLPLPAAPAPTSEKFRCNRMDAENTLSFLDEEERKTVAAVAAQILLPAENAKMHSVIIAERKLRAQWRKDLKNKPTDRWGRIKEPDPPNILKGDFSESSEARIYRIIDALIKAMEPLGCKLCPGMKFVVAGETVSISFSESQDKINHIPTKEENLRLVQYEEEKKRSSWASKPQIRKYDYVFNGKLSLTIDGKKYFRDCASYVLEDRLGDIMVALYSASWDERQRRIKAEEAEQKRREEELRKEERRKRYNAEVKRTIALENLASDFEMACRIRSYIEEYKKTHSGEEAERYIAWAEAKADWYDPNVSAEDEFFGKRDHSESWDSKTPKTRGSYWF